MRLDAIDERIARRQAGKTGNLTVSNPLVVCNEEHRFLVLEQLEEVDRKPSQIILEPVGRNTAPALTMAALSAVAEQADALLLVMPADHVIADRDKFQESVAMGIELAQDRMIVTFGIVTRRAETGFGYIRIGAPLTGVKDREAFVIDSFVEKPDRDTAGAYVSSGQYLWNSGMYMVRAALWLEAIGHFAPDMIAACREAWERGEADGVFYRVQRSVFEACPSDSIDYAVMERLTASNGGGTNPVSSGPDIAAAVVPLDAGWSDVGAWPALVELSDADGDGNVTDGDVFVHGARDNVLVSGHRLLAAVGIHDMIAVETADAVLVADKGSSQDVRHVVDWLRASGREESRSHRRVYRPWGHYELLDAGDRFQVKRLTVKPGAVLSLQMHHHRAEHWVVVRGTAKVTKGEEEFLIAENQSTYISLGVQHRLENPGKLPLEIIEVQSGSYLGEDDIVRFEDRYRRK